jgi:hypothetical protein
MYVIEYEDPGKSLASRMSDLKRLTLEAINVLVSQQLLDAPVGTADIGRYEINSTCICTTAMKHDDDIL